MRNLYNKGSSPDIKFRVPLHPAYWAEADGRHRTLEIKARRSSREAPFAGNDVGNYMIVYQCSRNAFRTFNGQCRCSSFPSCQSTINKQVKTSSCAKQHQESQKQHKQKAARNTANNEKTQNPTNTNIWEKSLLKNCCFWVLF